MKKEIENLVQINSHKLFRLDLAFEDYEDDTGNKISLLDETTLLLNEFRKSKDNMSLEEQLEFSNKILENYNKVLDLVGREKFVFYEDGDINYIWKGDGNE